MHREVNLRQSVSLFQPSLQWTFCQSSSLSGLIARSSQTQFLFLSADGVADTSRYAMHHSASQIKNEELSESNRKNIVQWGFETTNNSVWPRECPQLKWGFENTYNSVWPRECPQLKWGFETTYNSVWPRECSELREAENRWQPFRESFGRSGTATDIYTFSYIPSKPPSAICLVNNPLLCKGKRQNPRKMRNIFKAPSGHPCYLPAWWPSLQMIGAQNREEKRIISVTYLHSPPALWSLHFCTKWKSQRSRPEANLQNNSGCKHNSKGKLLSAKGKREKSGLKVSPQHIFQHKHTSITKLRIIKYCHNSVGEILFCRGKESKKQKQDYRIITSSTMVSPGAIC